MPFGLPLDHRCIWESTIRMASSFFSGPRPRLEEAAGRVNWRRALISSGFREGFHDGGKNSDRDHLRARGGGAGTGTRGASGERGETARRQGGVAEFRL